MVMKEGTGWREVPLEGGDLPEEQQPAEKPEPPKRGPARILEFKPKPKEGVVEDGELKLRKGVSPEAAREMENADRLLDSYVAEFLGGLGAALNYMDLLEETDEDWKRQIADFEKAREGWFDSLGEQKEVLARSGASDPKLESELDSALALLGSPDVAEVFLKPKDEALAALRSFVAKQLEALGIRPAN